MEIGSDTAQGSTEFVKVETTRTQDGSRVRSTTWFRVFTSTQTPTVMMLSYSCPVSAYSDSERDELLKSTSLFQSGRADMDQVNPDNTPGGAG